VVLDNHFNQRVPLFIYSKTIYLKAPFGWAFQPAFAFPKAKSQPKGSKATAALGQKLLLLCYKTKRSSSLLSAAFGIKKLPTCHLF
jgi:hypothetical protein